MFPFPNLKFRQNHSSKLGLFNTLFSNKISKCEAVENEVHQQANVDSMPQIDPYELVTFENFSREVKSVLTMDNYDGFRLEADKQILPNLHAGHYLFLGTLMKESGYLYQFGFTYANDKTSTLAMSKIDLDGVVTGRFFKKFNKNFEVKANCNSCLKVPSKNAYEFAADYYGTDWAASFKTAWQGTWILNGAFSQRIYRNLHIGGELTYICANGASIGSIGGRYVTGNHVFNVQLSRQPDFKSIETMLNQVDSLRFQYFKKITDRLMLASELEIIPQTKESALRAGWEYLFRHARVQGSIDTTGRIAMMAQDASGFGVNGIIDYWNNIYRFGFMMHLVPQQEPPKASTN